MNSSLEPWLPHLNRELAASCCRHCVIRICQACPIPSYIHGLTRGPRRLIDSNLIHMTMTAQNTQSGGPFNARDPTVTASPCHCLPPAGITDRRCSTWGFPRVLVICTCRYYQLSHLPSPEQEFLIDKYLLGIMSRKGNITAQKGREAQIGASVSHGG